VKVSREDRQALFQQYWGLQDYTRQWDFLNHYDSFSEPKKPDYNDDPQRSVGKCHIKTCTGSLIHVCQTMFLGTLNISEKPVYTAASRLKKKGAAISPDKRGHNCKKKPVVDRLIRTIDEHIRSIPIVPSHYCRKDTKKVYFEPGVTLAKLWSLYRASMQKKYPEMEPATFHRYRTRFLTEFNIGFFVPKSDQCELCNVSERAPPAIRAKIEDNLSQHLRIKDLA